MLLDRAIGWRKVLLCIAAGVAFVHLASCTRDEQVAAPPATPVRQSLQLITSYALTVTEPSGLAYAPTTRTLYMISDNRPEIFTIDTTGKVLSSIPVAAADIEGVAVSQGGDTLYIVQETASLFCTVLLNGTIVNTMSVTVRTDPKHSLEGVTIGAAGHRVVINEKLPTMLLEFAGTTEVQRMVLTYAADLSDICYDAAGDCYWIVSDESQKVIKISRSGALLGEWSIAVVQAEGIALIGNRVYIVSDTDAKLFVFVRP